MAIVNKGPVHALEFFMGNRQNGCYNWIMYLQFKKFKRVIIAVNLLG